MGTLDEALGFWVGGTADDHLGRQHPAKRLTLRGQLGPPGAPASDRALAVPHQRPRYRPELLDSRHHPANKSSARRLGISMANSQRE